MITMVQDSTSERTIAGLNLILRTLSQSLTLYLVDACPWVARDAMGKLETLHSIVADQRSLIEELGSAIMARHGIADRSGFPTEFTDLNDLSLDYLMKQAEKKYLPRDLLTMESAVEQLEGDRDAMELGQRIVGAAKAHLEMLSNGSRR